MGHGVGHRSLSLGYSPHQRPIFLSNLPAAKLQPQIVKSSLGLGDQHQARCLTVETMDQTRLPTAFANHQQIGTLCSKKIGQCILVASGKTVRRHPRRFVDHQHAIIFVYDRHSKLGLGNRSG